MCRAALLSVFALAAACVGRPQLAPQSMPGIDSDTVVWFAPTTDADIRALRRWRGSVGPALIVTEPTSHASRSTRLTVVSWNTHVGAADVLALVRDLRAQIGPDGQLVLLLQEVFRRGADVPRQLPSGAAFASRLGVLNGRLRERSDVAGIAAAAGLNLCYVPSMRNGGSSSDEDRGNAILSTLPLTDLAAIELPFERQRRVAVAATITGVSARGPPWSLRIVSAHLDNVGGLRRLWIAGSQAARTRQARGLVAHLAGSSPLVLGGDFNTWFGFADRAYRDTAAAFHATLPSDRRATFRNWLRLDHVFVRLPEGWTARTVRGHSAFGSDHSPLITTIDGM